MGNEKITSSQSSSYAPPLHLMKVTAGPQDYYPHYPRWCALPTLVCQDWQPFLDGVFFFF